MTYEQKKIQISAEDAINLIGCYYFINNGKHEEDLFLIIEQKLGKKSNFERDVETLDDAFELYDEILKQRCENIINRYKKYYDSIGGKVFYFLYRNGLLKDSRKKEVDEYLKNVDRAKFILNVGQAPTLKKLSEQFKNKLLIPEIFPQIGQALYVVDNHLTENFFKIDKYIVSDNSFSIENRNTDVREISVVSTCIKHDDSSKIKVSNNAILDFNGTSYMLSYNSRAFVKLSDAQAYAESKLLELIEQAKDAIQSNKPIK